VKLGDLLPDLPEPLAGLGVTLSVAEAASIAGLGRGTAYTAIRTGQWPSPVMKHGRRLVIPTLPFLRAMGVLA